MNGGFDQLGDGRGLNEIGKVQAEFWLHFSSYADATDQLDAFRKMTDYGVQRLFLQPMDQTDAERWCWARVNSLNGPQNVKSLPHKRMKVSANWQVTDSFWYGPGNGAVWGSGWKWGDGTKWGGTPLAASGTLTTTTITPSGNAFTYLQITIRPGAGQTCADPIVRRIVNGEVVDEVKFIGTLAATETLFINTSKREVRLNDVKVYDARFSAKDAAWMRLLPGANTIQIRFAGSGDAADVNLRYLDRWV